MTDRRKKIYLYEITTNLTGESYVRAYVWAESEEQAIDLFHQYNTKRYRYIRFRCLFDSSTKPFATKANDHGWDNEERCS